MTWDLIQNILIILLIIWNLNIVAQTNSGFRYVNRRMLRLRSR